MNQKVIYSKPRRIRQVCMLAATALTPIGIAMVPIQAVAQQKFNISFIRAK